ncbi:MAG: cardiolipin synthase [Defluviitaleaceae bacterium]|nr:cardiolipin synthase [Defluviitaleaceae bacterium]
MSVRMRLYLILIIVQIGALIVLSTTLLVWQPWVSHVGAVISFLCFFYILKNNDASAYKITWIIIVLAIPVVGGLIYLLFSKEHYVRRRIRAHAEKHAVVANILDTDGNLPFVNEVDCGRMFGLMEYIRNESSYHAFENTAVKYYPIGEAMFDDMLAEIEKAERFIFLEYFIISESFMWDTLLEALIRKAKSGVEIRLIVDDFGSQHLFTNRYMRHLRAQGIRVMRFNPLVPFLFSFMNTRDHRKVLVIDSQVAFVGGLNISDEYINRTDKFGIWKDTGVKLTGEAVWSCTLMFTEMWDTFSAPHDRINDHAQYKAPPQPVYGRGGLVLPYGDTPLDHEQLGENIYIEILNQAKRYVYIFTPYLIITEKMQHAICIAAKRGVDIRIITPGNPDKKMVYRLTRSYYPALLKAGVRIYKYTPGFLHAKSFVSDDEVAVVGTINLDYRSLYLHFENAVFMYKTPAIADIRDDALRTMTESDEVLHIEKPKRLWSGLFDSFLHLFAPLL